MSEQKITQTTGRPWEEALIEDYYDHRWRQLLEDHCEKLQRWKAGELTYDEMDQYIEEVHQQICETRSLFKQRRDRLVSLIQWWDRDWFLAWLEDHRLPLDVEPAAPPGFVVQGEKTP